MQFKSAKFFKNNKQKLQIMKGIYITKKHGYLYPMYEHSELATESQRLINGVINVLKTSKQAKVVTIDKTLLSKWDKNRKGLLLFIEKDNNGNIIRRFAVDMTE